MTQGESRLSRSIISKLCQLPDTFAWKNHASEFTPAGLPDIICVHKGRFYGFETKMPGKEENVSAVQRLMHDLLRRAGGRVYVVHSPAEAITHILNDP
jgi:hypothetical protein